MKNIDTDASEQFLKQNQSSSGMSEVRTSTCRYTFSEAFQGDTGLGAGPGDNRFKWKLSNA
jgi:hypothetical protein